MSKTALLIGNGRFNDPKLSALDAPKADVLSLQRLLLDPDIGGFDAVEVLTDADFSAANVAIGHLFGQAQTSDDTVLLYYSGHGQQNAAGHLYLATTNTMAGQLHGTAVSASSVREAMQGSRSRRQVLILDCCYSGAFNSAKNANDNPVLHQSTFATEGFGNHVLTASRGMELAYQGNQVIEGIETSLFTHFLIEGLSTGAAALGQEYVTARSLYDYAQKQVVAKTEKMSPMYWAERVEGDVLIARNPRPYNLPEDIERLLTSDDLGEREAAIGILTAWLTDSGKLESHREDARRALEMARVRALTTAHDSLNQKLNGLERIKAEHTELQGVERGQRRRGKLLVVLATVLLTFAVSLIVRTTPEVEQLTQSLGTVESALAQALADLSDENDRLEKSAVDAAAVAQSLIEAKKDLRIAEVKLSTLEQTNLRLKVRLTENEKSIEASVAAPTKKLAEAFAEPTLLAVTTLSLRRSLAKRFAANCGTQVHSDGVTFTCAGAPRVAAIPSGEFSMGSPEFELKRDDDEKRHKVSVRAFGMTATEVTFAAYDRFAGATAREKPSDNGWGRGQRPVINVSWQDATSYAKWLSETTGRNYRLPTEAEWEYAARAGTQGPFSFKGKISSGKVNYDASSTYDDSEIGTFRQHTVKAGGLEANPWGLHEVHGNVWEWVQDCYQTYDAAPTNGSAAEGCTGDASRLLRGGSWGSFPRGVRSAARAGYQQDNRNYNIGFRLAQDFF